MASTTESSAIVRFIHGVQPPILERQHSIETEVVANPYFAPTATTTTTTMGAVERPARRSYVPQVALALAGAAVIAALIIYWAERRTTTTTTTTTAAIAPMPGPQPQSIAAVVPAAPDPEPIVIAVPTEADEPATEQAPPEPAAIVARTAPPPSVLRRADRESQQAHRAPAVRRGKARPRTEVPTLTSTKGVLMIASKPPCHIIINGQETGLTTPQSLIRLKTGRHELTLVNQEHDIRTSIPVTIRAGKSVRVVKDLTDQMKRSPR
jgi:hypothetical protein